MLIFILYNELSESNNISNSTLESILDLKDIILKPVKQENKLIIKKNYDHYERILSDLIDKERKKSNLEYFQIYDSNDDILTLAYKLSLLRNEHYKKLMKLTPKCIKNIQFSSFNLLNNLLKCLIIILLIIFVIIIIIYIIKQIYNCIHKKM